MPVVYFDEKDRETGPEKAAYAVVRRTAELKSQLCICPSCKRKLSASEFVSLGVCKACDEKRKERSKSFKRRYDGLAGMTKATRRQTKRTSSKHTVF